MKTNVQSSDRDGRIIGLDLLRITLALLVFMFHSHLQFSCDYGLLNSFVSMGAIAMTGFMMLSGFVLFSTYRKKQLWSIREIKQFYIKRLITILPLYYSIAILHSIYQLSTGKLSVIDAAILFPVEAFAIQSTFFSLFSLSHNGGTWFISCILICYTIYPFLQCLLLQMGKKARLKLLVVLCVILLYSPIVRIYFHLDWITIYANPFYRLIEFTIGMLLVQTISTYKERISRFSNIYSLSFTILALIIFVTIARRIGVPGDYMLFNWIALPCFCILIMILSVMKCTCIQHSNVIRYLSGISFTFFLCQVLPLWTFSKIICEYISLGSNDNMVRIICSFTLCLGGGVFIHECIEKNCSKYLKRKWLKQ